MGEGEELLPWNCCVRFSPTMTRRYSMFFWTVGHGGRTRSQTEYRIQTKLGSQRRLSFEHGTTILLGYYIDVADKVGRELGNSPPKGMEVFVAWDPVAHLRLGSSSSCQVSFDLLQKGFEWGLAATKRRISGDITETILAMRAEHLGDYLQAAAGGHNKVDTEALTRKATVRQVRTAP